LSVVVGYTYSHALDDSSHYFASNFPQDSRHPDADYGASDFDVRHHFTLSTTYNVPGKKSFGQMLEGWQVNSIVHLQTGLPWNAVDGSTDISGTGEFLDRWDFFGNPNDFMTGRQNLVNGIPFYSGGAANMPSVCVNAASAVGLQADIAPGGLGCYSQGSSALLAPLPGTYGTASRNEFRADHFRNWDISIFKIWRVKERFSAQFRAEFFNMLNIANCYPPSGTLVSAGFGALTKTPDVGSTNPGLGTGGPRAIELGLKLGF
jgi:hypothetical protein